MPNRQVFKEAFGIYTEFIQERFADEIRAHRDANPDRYVQSKDLHVDEANERLPKDGFLSCYCDLLGFSVELMEPGVDSLPDYYGAAFAAAHFFPEVRVYLISDTCIATAPVAIAADFLRFISFVFDRWLADAMLPQCIIGFGSFVERRPEFGGSPQNFFGTQIAGTALLNAMNWHKAHKPLGSRILMTQTATENIPADLMANARLDANRANEFLPRRWPHLDLLDCLYYFLLLRGREPGSRLFEHFIWSLASRIYRSGGDIAALACQLAAPQYETGDIREVSAAAVKVVQAYRRL